MEAAGRDIVQSQNILVSCHLTQRNLQPDVKYLQVEHMTVCKVSILFLLKSVLESNT